VYGGCDGNENRFSSLEECKFMCELPLSQWFKINVNKIKLKFL
jgi:hypothetical protein